MTSSMLRRQLKNLVQNYSEAEVKVREATSNDPWGPSSTQMADISDLTYNVVACNEIMTMLWKRLKDDRNWRHIHKSLTLLEYLLKTGDDRVLLKMKDNIYIVKALTEYRFVEKDGKDQGVNVREKAKVVLVLMEDDDKLKEERDFAFKTREKTSKGSAASSADTLKDPNYKPCYVPGATGLPTITNIPSVADLAADFAARKEERLKQEAEKKETERRAKMSEDELKWEDAGKGSGVQVEAWGGQKSEEEEAKPGPWGATKEPKEAEGPWGTPDRPETTDTEMTESTDAWGAPVKSKEDPFAKADEDPFAAPKNGEDPFVEEEDPFSAPKDDPFTAKDSSDAFSAPKDKKSPDDKTDRFTASEDDPFTSKKDDPFNTPKDDPFSTAKNDPFASDKEDPFNTPKDDPFTTKADDPFTAAKDDPFNTPKDDPFNTPKDDPFTANTEDPFGAPKDDPFTSSKDDPFNTPKDDPFKTQAEDPFGATKDDPFTSKQDDPFSAPKDDPFSSSKDDPFTSEQKVPTSPPPKEDPFSAPSQPTEDPFGAPTSPPKEDPFSAPSQPTEDPFGAPTSPPKEDPFSAPSQPTEDPFAAPTSPPKEDPFSAPSKLSEDPFGAPTSPPKEDPFSATSKSPEDPFGAPTSPPIEDQFTAPASPPKEAALDPFSAPSASSPQDRTDAWGEAASPPPATAAAAWGATSPSQGTNAGDPWADGASATSPVDNSDPFGDSSKLDNDPWGAPASAPVNADDAWGSPAPPSATSPSDPFGSKGDPWGAPSSTPSDGTGKRLSKDKEMYKKTASFLGSAGASLVDLDDLFSTNAKPKYGGPVFANAVAGQTQATGALNAPLPVSYPQAAAFPGGQFGSILAPSYSALGAARQSTEPSLFRSQIEDVSHFGCTVGQLGSGGGPFQTQPFPVGPQTVFGTQMTQPGPLFGDFSALAGLQQTGDAPPMGGGVSNQLCPNSSTSETNNNYNPFLI